MEWIELGELGEVLSGYAFKSKKYVNKGIRVIRITNVQNGYLEDDDPKYYSEEDIEGLERYLLLEDDILISLTGNVGRVAKLEKKFLPAALNQRVACVRANKRISDEYLYYMLNSNYFENRCISQSKGVAQKNLGITNLKKIKIPAPPMEIQEKIVKVLDQAQALIDKRKEQIEALDQLIESIFYTMFGDPVRNEKGWEVKELEEVLLNNVSNIKKDFKDDISYIDIGSINNNNNSIETYNNFKIKDAPSRAKRILNHGDILLSTVRPNLKNIAIFDMYTENTAIGSTGFCIIRVNESLVNNKYIFNVVKNKRFTGYLVKIAEGASYPAVKDSDIKSIKISIPPLSLQNEFADNVETIEKQKEVLRESLELLEENYKSIMDKAFKGQLFN